MHAGDGGVFLDPGDLARFRLLREAFPAPEPSHPGRWLSESPDQLWLELVTQLAVAGGRRPVQRMWENGEIHQLALRPLLDLISGSSAAAVARVHSVLARNGVRYASTSSSAPSRKAVQIVAAACSTDLVRDGEFRLQDLLLPGLPETPAWSPESRNRERRARSVLIQVVDGFGMKSASDYLNHIGASLNLLAFDSRIQTLLRDGFGLSDEVQRRYVARPRLYEQLERPFVEEVCPDLRLCPAELDALMFHNSEPARRLLRC